VSNSI